ncbi:MAG: 50S ribosomal protein L20 [Acidobacteriota bacterium]|nr:50S ribosomal protein L20 [Acidobacteriota bacterium]
MPRVKRGTKRRASRHKTLERASGFFLTKSKLHRAAQEAVERALKFAYTGRKHKKREFRSLWIVRIGAACREAGTTYSKFMHGLKLAGIELDRKVLAEVAMADGAAFSLLIDQAKTALANVPASPHPVAHKQDAPEVTTS